MKFIKYPSLTNHYVAHRDKTIKVALNDQWYSTEKIHGSNVSVVFDKELNHEWASRTAFINQDSPTMDNLNIWINI